MYGCMDRWIHTNSSTRWMEGWVADPGHTTVLAMIHLRGPDEIARWNGEHNWGLPWAAKAQRPRPIAYGVVSAGHPGHLDKGRVACVARRLGLSWSGVPLWWYRPAVCYVMVSIASQVCRNGQVFIHYTQLPMTGFSRLHTHSC